jgi:hypothetical protein
MIGVDVTQTNNCLHEAFKLLFHGKWLWNRKPSLDSGSFSNSIPPFPEVLIVVERQVSTSWMNTAQPHPWRHGNVGNREFVTRCKAP